MAQMKDGSKQALPQGTLVIFDKGFPIQADLPEADTVHLKVPRAAQDGHLLPAVAALETSTLCSSRRTLIERSVALKALTLDT